ncbi:hypothetical protein [Methylobacterium iners]|uniref:hypothetical protein n=1 Tax=Methylobacterium iners TaxID=418707 RepID=UPI001EE325A4|nr:hypothetical protein [Methylobacterium iners]
MRLLQHARGNRSSSDVGLGSYSVADARESLGAELAAYVALCVDSRTPLPSQDVRREYADDALYRGRLRRAMLADLDLWAAARDKRARERIEYQEARVPPPDEFYMPPSVEAALAARSEARRKEAEERRKSGGRGGATAFALAKQAQREAEADSPPIPDGDPLADTTPSTATR